MKKEELFNIVKKFKIEGEPFEIIMNNSGHINKTYIVKTKLPDKTVKNYILQYINGNVFPNIEKLMDNINQVTKYISKNVISKNGDPKKSTITMIDTIDNSPNMLYNGNWRMEEYIENTLSYTETDKLEVLYEAGKAIGNFQKELDGFPANELFEVIENFHNTPNRYKQFMYAITDEDNIENRKERFKLAKDSIQFLLDNTRLAKIDLIITKLCSRRTSIKSYT